MKNQIKETASFQSVDPWGKLEGKGSGAHLIATLWKWDSAPDNSVPAEIVEANGYKWTDEMQAARDLEVSNLFKAYADAQANRTPEQIAEENFEMRAAFGPGAEVVNVITGKVTRL